MHSDKPLVSVIMPAYNAEKYIVEAIESILNQTYDHLELLICDDCSSDHTVDILKKFERDNRVRIFFNDTNKGAAATRNFLIREAKGTYIALQDADDISSEFRLEKQVKSILKDGWDACGTSCYYFKHLDTKEIISQHFVVVQPALLFWSAFFNLSFCNSSLVLNREKFLSIGLYDEKLRSESEDKDLIIRCLLNGYVIGNVREILYGYRCNPESVSFVNRDTQKSNSLKTTENLYSKFLEIDNVENGFIEFVKYYHLQKYNFTHGQVPMFYSLLSDLFKRFRSVLTLNKEEEKIIRTELGLKLAFLSLQLRKVNFLSFLKFYFRTIIFNPSVLYLNLKSKLYV